MCVRQCAIVTTFKVGANTGGSNVYLKACLTINKPVPRRGKLNFIFFFLLQDTHKQTKKALLTK